MFAGSGLLGARGAEVDDGGAGPCKGRGVTIMVGSLDDTCIVRLKARAIDGKAERDGARRSDLSFDVSCGCANSTDLVRPGRFDQES